MQTGRSVILNFGSYVFNGIVSVPQMINSWLHSVISQGSPPVQAVWTTSCGSATSSVEPKYFFPAMHCTTGSQGCSCSRFYFWSGISKGIIFWDCL